MIAMTNPRTSRLPQREKTIYDKIESNYIVMIIAMFIGFILSPVIFPFVAVKAISKMQCKQTKK